MAEKSYIGYGKRRALDAVDYAAISKKFIDFVDEERKTREAKRQEIQENYDQTLIDLAKIPEGPHGWTTDFTLHFTDQATALLLQANRALRQGKMSVREYSTIVNNLNRDAEILFGVAERLQADYATFEEDFAAGDASMGDLLLRQRAEKFARMGDHRAIIDPKTGSAAIGEMELQDPTKPFDPETNPYTGKIRGGVDAAMFIGQLNGALSTKHAAFNQDAFNDDIATIDASGGFSMETDEDGTVISTSGISDSGKEAIRSYAKEHLTDPWKLYDYAARNDLTEDGVMNEASEDRVSFIPDPSNPGGNTGFTIDTNTAYYKDLEERAIEHLYQRGLSQFGDEHKVERLPPTELERARANAQIARNYHEINKDKAKEEKEEDLRQLIIDNVKRLYTGTEEEKTDAASNLWKATGVVVEAPTHRGVFMLSGRNQYGRFETTSSAKDMKSMLDYFSFAADLPLEVDTSELSDYQNGTFNHGITEQFEAPANREVQIRAMLSDPNRKAALLNQMAANIPNFKYENGQATYDAKGYRDVDSLSETQIIEILIDKGKNLIGYGVTETTTGSRPVRTSGGGMRNF